MFTERCINLIKKYEGFSPKPYICPAGYVTIGYGQVLGPKETLHKFKDLRITEKEATEFLYKKVFADYVIIKPWIRVKMHPYMWDAILSFVYNVGTGKFRASTLRRKINSAMFYDAANEFMKWVYAGGKVLKGLVRRRTEEKELFLEGVALLEKYEKYG